MTWKDCNFLLLSVDRLNTSFFYWPSCKKVILEVRWKIEDPIFCPFSMSIWSFFLNLTCIFCNLLSMGYFWLEIKSASSANQIKIIKGKSPNLWNVITKTTFVRNSGKNVLIELAYGSFKIFVMAENVLTFKLSRKCQDSFGLPGSQL